MMRALVRSAGAIFAIFALLDVAAGRADPTPSSAIDTVRTFHAQLSTVMRNAAALGARGRYQDLALVVQRTFDVPFMTEAAIGPTWDHLTQEQRQRAETAFGRYITATYAHEFEGYSGELKVVDEQRVRSGELVRTQLLNAKSDPVSLNYVLNDKNGAWQIRDVYLNGTISQLATRRSEFTAILRTQGIEGLITTLNKKADELV